MCYKPGCNKHCEAYDEGMIYGSKFCDDCYYPGIEEDYANYRDYREEGYSAYQSKLMVGWADPPE